MSPLENLCNLFFELSNEDRLRILHQLVKDATNITGLSKALDLTTQESSRHVARLSDVGLTLKNVDGLNNLTHYGELILKQIEGLKFTTQHKDYFASHTVAHIPIEFVARIGELADSTYVDDISDIFYRIDNVIREAKEWVCTITNQYLMSTYSLLRDALERKVKVANIEAQDWVVSPKMKQGFYSNEARWVAMRQTFTEARTTGLLEERMLESLDIFLYMSESEIAGVAFPLPDEKFDYLGFSGKSERAHKWCKDLFQHYWKKAHPRQRLIEELYRWVEKRPEAIRVLKALSEGKEITYGDELIPKLESMNLIREGELTVLGDFVVAELRK